MQIKAYLAALVGATMMVDAADMHHSPFKSVLERRQNRFGGNNQGNRGNNGNNGNNNNNNNKNNNGGNNIFLLSKNAIQEGSAQNGNNPGSGEQATSATDKANFINFCAGQTLTNGLQIRGGSCNGIPMGRLPAANRMVSSLVLNPRAGEQLFERTEFDVQVQTINFQAGSFTNATTTYYSAPQDLNRNGFIIGHAHITIQDLGPTMNPTRPLNPEVFAFFKGINDAGNGKGLLSARVVGGLPVGFFRVCTMLSSANHQPVTMPVAQRGAQDDCIRFQVVKRGARNNGNNNNANNNNGNNIIKNKNGQNNNQQFRGQKGNFKQVQNGRQQQGGQKKTGRGVFKP